jgi:hypothetical protein
MRPQVMWMIGAAAYLVGVVVVLVMIASRRHREPAVPRPIAALDEKGGANSFGSEASEAFRAIGSLSIPTGGRTWDSRPAGSAETVSLPGCGCPGPRAPGPRSASPRSPAASVFSHLYVAAPGQSVNGVVAVNQGGQGCWC